MIPAITVSGVLPPYVGDAATDKPGMSPYQVSMTDLCSHYATSPERIKILSGLISYRDALRKAGFTEGVQWIDGSFVEDVETLRGRPPGDIDVVTFSALNRTLETEEAIENFLNTYGWLLDSDECKKQFLCDAYLVNLTAPPRILVDDTRYWFGLFSHQRETALWKGMLAVDLESDDQQAALFLEGREP